MWRMRDQLALADIQLHKTDTTTFKEKLSNPQKDLITCPILMSGSCEVDMADVSDDPVKVEMVRRVARFDINNDSEETIFVIRQIALGNVPNQGTLFASHKWDAAERIQLPLIDFLAIDGSNGGVAPSSFYLYPTNETTDGDKAISFNLIGHSTSSDETQVVSVKFFDIKGKPVKIEANHRYTVQVDPAGQGCLTATLAVEDWLVGDTVNVQTNWGTIGVSSESTAFEDNTLTLEADKVGEADEAITLSVACDGEWRLEKDDKIDWLEVETVAGSEGAASTSFTVKTIKTNYSSEQRQTTVTVVNSNQPSVRQPIVVVQKGNASSAITFAADLSSIGGASLIENVLKVPASQSEAISVQVTTSIIDWKLADGSYTGLTVAKTGDGLTVTPEENKSTKARTNTITITDNSDDPLITLQVVQSGVAVGAITVKCTDLENSGAEGYTLAVDAAGFPEIDGTETELNNHRKISVVSTAKWEYKIVYPWQEIEGGVEGEQWLSVYHSNQGNKGITETLGTHNGYFYLKATQNAGEQRTAKIKIMDAVNYTSVKTIVITQAATGN